MLNLKVEQRGGMTAGSSEPTMDVMLNPLRSQASSAWPRHGPILLWLAIVTVAARAATFGNPVIGFDEQFYLLVGDRMLQGALPYVDIFDRKPVGLFLIYAAARLLGGDGFVEYKIVAALSVLGTAYLLYRTARHRCSGFGATAAATTYVLWLNFMEGEGGQAPVFYNLPMMAAGALLLGAARDPRRLDRRGVGAMLATGVALQIKYSVVFEGVFFGCAFLWLAWRAGRTVSGMVWFAARLIVAALLPTLMVLLYYWRAGHLAEFWFCNFVSAMGQGRGPILMQFGALATIAGILLPLLIAGMLGRVPRPSTFPASELTVLRGWLVAAILGVLVYWRFNSPHYGMPILLPACLMLAPVLAARRALAFGLPVAAFVAGQAVLALSVAHKGGAEQARAVAAAAAPRTGCIFVYDGYPALYMLTHSCLPSRWAFPGHMNMADESGPQALGVDPSVEIRRILARRPDAILDTYPTYRFVNRATHAILARTLRDQYTLTACIETWPGRYRLVYRPADTAVHRGPSGCPGAMVTPATRPRHPA